MLAWSCAIIYCMGNLWKSAIHGPLKGTVIYNRWIFQHSMFDYQRVYHIGPIISVWTEEYQAFEPEPYWANNPRWNPSIASEVGNSSSQVNFYSMEGEQRLCDHIPMAPMATAMLDGASDVWNAIHATIFLEPKILGNAMIGTWNTSSTGFQPNTLMKPMDHGCNLIIFNQQKSSTVAIEPS